MTDTSWTAFPGTTNVKLWIGPGDTVRNALTLYNPSSIPGRMIKHITRNLPEAVARTLLPKRHDENVADLNGLSEQLRNITGKPDAKISFYTGTPGPHRKRTAQISDAGHVSLYAKIGSTASARDLILREHNNLMLLQKLPDAPFSMPEATSCIEEDKQVIAVQTAPDYTAITTRGPGLLDADLEAFVWLSSIHKNSQQLSVLLKDHDVTDMVSGIEAQDPSCAATLHNAIALLQDIFDTRDVQTSFAHGDYTPWNTLKYDKNGLYIFDWEYARSDMPALFDLTHFIFMHTRLVAGLPAPTAISRILDRLNTITGHPCVNVIAEQGLLNAHIILYLLLLLARNYEAGARPDDYLIRCIHNVLLRSGATEEPFHVLVAAYACDPEEGSEPGVGWNMVTAIARQHKAWVVTRSNNRTPIEAKLLEEPQPNLHFIYVDLPRWAAFWKKGGRGIRTYYYLWQLLALYHSTKLIKTKDFDLAHHVTFVNDWTYSFAPLTGLPTVWGPIGSNSSIPLPFCLDYTTFIQDRIRYGFKAFMRIIDPLFWICSIRSKLIIGIEKAVIDRMPPTPGIKNRFIAHTAIGVESLPPARKEITHDTETLRVLSVGRLITIKGFHMTLMAFSEFSRHYPNTTLTIIGKGPLKDRLIRISHELGISDSVEFIDWLPRNDVLAAMQEADIFLFPSLEGGGMVVLEAMANQVPVVCLDYGGAGLMVGTECGLKIQPSSLSATVASLGEALRYYADNPSKRMEHGRNARQHVESNYLWQNRTAAIDSWYRKAVNAQPRHSPSRTS